ncbi:MAG: chromate efflux transporter [Acidocella sp.]|nr:chromate efflux transporter [Acidocella sp.]
MVDRDRSAFGVFWVFLRLGVTCFGGPVAHIGYFRRAFVDQRAWLSPEDFAGLVGLCQFLPGPGSSQLGFCLGRRRAGWPGGVAAFLGFTLPSFLLMVLAAHFVRQFGHMGRVALALHGLQLAAVAVVAQAVWRMAADCCPDTPRRALALLAAAILGYLPDTSGQIIVLVTGAVIGYLALQMPPGTLAAKRAGWRAHRVALAGGGVFLLLLVLCFMAPPTGVLALGAAFFRAGALVFGGGHVVLPLLRDAVVVPGWVSPRLFLDGYGLAQALPGPLFAVAGFLGAVARQGPGGVAGASLALVAIFTPGLLLVACVLPYWAGLQARPAVGAMMRGVNAAVVGLLGAAFINLLTLSSVRGVWDLPVMGVAVLLLTLGRVRPVFVVMFCAAAGMAM